MKLLFLHKNHPCYLAESLAHGLRQALGSRFVDVPRYDSLYAGEKPGVKKPMLRSSGFTLYGLLDDRADLQPARDRWRDELQTYDLVVLAHIWEQGDLLRDLRNQLPARKIAILDGTDEPIFFPFAWRSWNLYRHPSWFFVKRSGIPYFKRELTDGGSAYHLGGLLPRAWNRRVPFPGMARPISFSIPADKIRRVPPMEKTQDFPTHLVDPEVAAHTPGSAYTAVGTDPRTFTSEDDYYDDLRKSRFGITTRRAGWDCLRHYELASQGCVLCFRDLDLKPEACAPHGLSRENCMIYHSYADLRAQIDALSPSAYAALQDRTYAWVEDNTTVRRARQFLKSCGVPS